MSTILASATEGNQRRNIVKSNDSSQDGMLLFVNHHLVNGSQNICRPDRRIVGSHVQRVIRKRKRLSAEIRLMPVKFRGPLLGSNARQSGRIEKNHLNHRGSIHDTSRQPKPCSRELESSKGHFPTYQRLQKEVKTNENEKKPLLQSETEQPRRSGPDLELGQWLTAVEVKLLGSNISRMFFQFCELCYYLP